MIDLPQRCFIGRVNPRWFARVRPLYLNYTGSETLTDYQVRCTLTPSDIPFEKLREDKSDLLFVDSYDEVIPYWIEKSNSSELVVWLKFPHIKTGREIFWLYYGNGDFTGISNGNEVFLFFDDFEGTSLSTNKWEVPSGTAYQVANGLLKITNTDVRIQSKTTFSEGVALELKVKPVTLPPNGFEAGGFYLSSSNAILYHRDPNRDYVRNDDSWNSLGEELLALGVWHKLIFTAFFDGTTHTVNIKAIRLDTGEIVYQGDWTNTVSDEKITLSRRPDEKYTDQSYEAYWDWIGVRKYTAPEPFISK